MRDYTTIKSLADYRRLDEPEFVVCPSPPEPPVRQLYVLRMLVRPKYGKLHIPPELSFIRQEIEFFCRYDRTRTKINDSWCYVTIRHGPIRSTGDDDFHFDGSSFRTDTLPERNYIWCSYAGIEYKTGDLRFPPDFDPLQHHIFGFVEQQLEDQPIRACIARRWYLLSPFVFHRRPKLAPRTRRLFYRVSFTDIEIRDINNTPNPILPTCFFGRDPVTTFRDKLIPYEIDKPV